MKIAINNCFRGFSLSPKAYKRLAELQGKECYFFYIDFTRDGDKYFPITIEEADKKIMFFAFSENNPNEHLSKKDKDGSYKTSNEYYKKIRIDFEERTDKNLIQVIEELGKEANGSCAELKIIEIPDDIEYEISEYDGAESVHEKHRSWN